MSNVITCASMVEPKGFFDKGGQSAVFSTLNFNATTGTEDDAAVAFKTFADEVKKASFYLYRISGPPAGPFDLDLDAGGVGLTTVGPPPQDLAGKIVAWIGDVFAARKKSTWVFDPAAQPSNPDYRDVAATHLLDAVERWDAPIPQLAGLSRVVLTAAAQATSDYVVIPCVGASAGQGGMPAKIAGIARDGDCYVVPPNTIANLNSELRCTAITSLPALSLIDTDTGFLNVDTDRKLYPDAIALNEFLTRVRERSGSRLAVAPQMLNIGWPPATVAPDELWKMSLRRLRWRAINALLAMLDPVFMLTTMATAPDDVREGPVITALSAATGDALHDQGKEYPSSDAATVAHWIKTAVRSIVAFDSATPNVRTAFVSSLGAIYGVSDMLSLSANKVGPALTDVPHLVPLLLSLYERYGVDDTPIVTNPFAARAADWLADLDLQLDRELTQLLNALESEEGVEMAILTVLKLAGIDAENLVKQVPALGLAAAQKIFADFERTVRSNLFNGAEAARNLQGTRYDLALTTPATTVSPRPRMTKADLEKRLTDANWFAHRLGLGLNVAKKEAFDEIADWLPLAALPLDQSDIDFLVDPARAQSLAARYAEACSDLRPRAKVMGRIVPDQLPQGLPVQIAVDQDAGEAEAFAIAYNGVGLLVRRDQEGWAHANLAMLTLRDRTKGGPSIHPVLATANDGHFNIILDYQGDPLARTLAASAAIKAREATLPGFYIYDDPDPTHLGAFRKLPALGYGHSYDVASFVVGKSGSLPSTVAKSVDEPWLPNVVPDVPKGGFFGRIPYWRSTAVGQVALGDASVGTSDAVARFAPFNSAIDGVMPLARDYPRTSHVADVGNQARFDLYRDALGRGVIGLPSDSAAVKQGLEQWAWSGGLTVLTIELMASDDDTVAALATWPIAISGPEAQVAMSVTLTRVAGNQIKCSLDLGASKTATTPQADFTIPLPPKSNGVWLRCKIAATKSEGAISLPDPRSETNSVRRSTPGGGGFLLLAPANSTLWKRSAPTLGTLNITYPRMSFVDFDRWLNGQNLFDEAKDAGSKLKDFWEGLHTLRHDPHLDEKTATWIGQMPDLAVTGLLVELVAIDTLNSVPLPPFCDVIKVPRLSDLLTGVPAKTELASLAAKLQKQLIVSVGPDLTCNLAAGTITVPKGVVAELRIRPLVPQRYFDDPKLRAFNDNIPLWAAGSYADKNGNKFLIFDGPTVVIEAMRELDPDVHDAQSWTYLASDAIGVQTFGAERRYDIVAAPTTAAARDRWRHLGSIDVATQRWRYLGRPIAAQLDREELSKPFSAEKRKSPVRELPRAAEARVDAFEEEIFGSQYVDDADTQTVVLRPQPINVLQSVPWEKPAATLFRHRVVLRSRYAGAMRNPSSGQLTVTATTERPNGMRLRVAMLADRPRTTLTRPQIRALMPLPVGVDQTAKTPPLLVMLEERPLDFGGLAERIAAEVKMGLGYELIDPGPVKLKDTRKEVGPDPRLSYSPLDRDDASGIVLETEGAIGLSYDSVSGAPSWANSAMLLQPKLLQSGKAATARLEEYFISVSLRRYIATDWSVEDPDPLSLSQIPLTEPCWCELADAPTITVQLSGGAPPLVSVKKITDARWSVEFESQFLQPESKGLVSLAIVDAIAGSRIAFMHQPLEPGRSSLSVFLLRPDVEPVVLASVDWSLPTRPGSTTPALAPVLAPAPMSILIDPPTIRSSRVAGSTATSMNWAKTMSDAGLVELAIPSSGELETVAVTDLVVSAVDGGSLSRSLRRLGSNASRWVRPALAAHRSPLFVHRHLAMIVTRGAGGLGRSLEQFQEARLMPTASLYPFGASPSQHLRVVEFETPARPIARGDHVPDEFLSAIFDLKAILPSAQTKLPTFLLFIRPLGDALALGPAKPFGFTVGGRASNGAQIAGVRLVLNCAENITVASIVIAIDASANRIVATAVDGTGGSHALIFGNHDPVRADLLQTLEISAYLPSPSSPTTESWADISLLTYPEPLPVDKFDPAVLRLSFDWFFTNDSEGTAVDQRDKSERAVTANEAMSQSALRDLREAQARIVSISPVLSVQND